MKKKYGFFKIFFLLCFIVTFLLFCLTLLGDKNPLSALDYKHSLYNNQEDFDPSLIGLNNLDKLENYCDSLFRETYQETNANQFETNYTYLVSSIVKKRFYWGYSCYTFNSNYLSLQFSRITHWGYNAIVNPDDILKYPNAACSQQSIVMLELLKRKGFLTRKVGFYSDSIKAGHFALEVFYNKAWHFYDPTLEPDTGILNRYNHPDIKFLTNHPTILQAAYSKSNIAGLLVILNSYKVGKSNVFPAPNALIFHRVTKFLSNTIYIFFLLAYLITRRIHKKYTLVSGNT